ncbi:MAG: hypothetical protein K8J08_12270 [Thermoanaerobaculia bacterium]|nr:hypothetical protein [Thermoanaerobaculia bacterium]
MMDSRHQKGESKLGCMLWVLVFGVAALIAFKMIPVKIQTSQLHDFMIEQARHGTARIDNDRLRKAIVRRAKELDLPLELDNVKVEMQRKRVRMEAKYVVPVEFPGYTYYWEFNHTVDETKFLTD